MLPSGRSDLALEVMQLAEGEAGEATHLRGVVAREEAFSDYSITTVEVLDEEGEAAIGKPRGRYVTLSLPALCQREKADYFAAAELLAAELTKLLRLPADAPVLVAGLGNRAVTPDAIGPHTLDTLLVTRHLIEHLPEHFAAFRPVSALAAGVMGNTGMESGELIAAVVRATRPACVIAVDALASRAAGRLFTTIQLADTGIVPGSGVGNHRMALNKETLGVPVIAVGVPTVVDAATFCLDVLASAGQTGADEAALTAVCGELFVTPREVDRFGETLAKVLGLGISRALHGNLTLEDIERLL